MVQRLFAALRDHGYRALVLTATPSAPDVGRVVRRILDHQVDGIVIASVSISASIADG